MKDDDPSACLAFENASKSDCACLRRSERNKKGDKSTKATQYIFIKLRNGDDEENV